MISDVPLRVQRALIDCAPRSLTISLPSGRDGGKRDFPSQIDDFQCSNFCYGGRQNLFPAEGRRHELTIAPRSVAIELA